MKGVAQWTSSRSPLSRKCVGNSVTVLGNRSTIRKVRTALEAALGTSSSTPTMSLLLNPQL